MTKGVFPPQFSAPLRPVMQRAYNPRAALFAHGELGAWFSVNPATAFSDTGRSSPASLAGTVAGITDLSGNDKHAAQTTVGDQPVFARVPTTGDLNRIPSPTILETGSLLYSPIRTANAAANPITGDTDAVLFEVAAGQTGFQVRSVAAAVNNADTANSLYIKPVSIAGTARIAFSQAERLSQTAITYPGFTPIVNGTTSGMTNINTNATALEDGWYRLNCSYSQGVLAAAEMRIAVLSATAGDQFLFYGPQVQTGLTITPLQFRVSAYDITQLGIQSQWYLADASSDSIVWDAPAGTYTIAYADESGPVLLEGQSLSGLTDIMLGSKVSEYVAIDRVLGSAEKRRLLSYMAQQSAGL